jgi:hypothetical protein
MWCSVSSSALQSWQTALAARTCLIKRSAVQHLRRSASQAWRRNFIGAKECHTCGAPGSAVDPSKRNRYADLEEKTPSADHFHRKPSPSAPVGTLATASHRRKNWTVASTDSGPAMWRTQAWPRSPCCTFYGWQSVASGARQQPVLEPAPLSLRSMDLTKKEWRC